MILIGIAGKKRSGKDTVADFLIEKFYPNQVIKLGFADEVKTIVARMVQSVDPRFLTAPTREVQKYIEANKQLFRPLLQWTGTDYFRTVFGEDIWIKKFAQKILNLGDSTQIAIVTDIRFLNEVNFIKDAGGFLLKVSRNASATIGQSTDEHISETQLDSYRDFDYTIRNDLSLKSLDLCVDDLVKALKNKYKEEIKNNE